MKAKIRTVTLRRAWKVCEVPETFGTSQGKSMIGPDVVAALFSFLKHEPCEQFWVAHLDAKHKVQSLSKVSEGILNSSLVHPREVFAGAIREMACAIIVVHNHPSGDPEPSSEDLEVTRRLRRAGRLLGIPLVDHVIIADDEFTSIAARLW